ncbi:monovalent cation:proton antiporter-2 (CPA2) family protein [Prosthecomicrobium pneumaticum]|uniref:Glutathione-regulated potassium-efflux system protein KefB n=1 Tax=Prosthecomicrobium pneumaticum TaxID=81895 RepID=A0A7W9FL15_9HYPH|nr:monovalent cation:proton antiporter-2 (CPA2) family protein [Prosthecomicrobium pneumaticum]MBB5752113.1 glutathione-regulated potassium-efflux system protein KefB [Prosthecomicrobium pneumaticum]
MAVETDPAFTAAAALLGAGVLAVPLFKRLGLGSVLGYLAAGVLIGPFGLGLFTDPEAILHVAELGVVMFLFVIGLEMQPSRLWGLRREIFGLGAFQVAACGAATMAAGIAIGFPPLVAFVAGMGFTLSSTAIIMQILEERGDIATAPGQRMVSILLLEDLSIVPLLAVVALFAPGGGEATAMDRLTSVAIAAAAVAVVVAAGRWLLNPMFRILAAARAREVMTAAALLVVLGAALIMDLGGLSMAMGAFLAGVLLSESTFRHQLEADIEPFRGILLGLFFLSVGMALDLAVIGREWPIVLAAVLAFMVVKGTAIYLVARLTRAKHGEALSRAVLFAQGGEFAFVLYTAASGSGILPGETQAVLTAAVILSMALTPLAMLVLRFVLPKPKPAEIEEDFAGAGGKVLLIGFGRFGQIASQFMLAQGLDVTAIDNDVEMIDSAGRFGFKVYFGDGTRLDVLRAAGIEEADLVAICTDRKEATSRVVEVIREAYPMKKLYVRSFDRVHTIELIEAGVDYQVRELYESAFTFGQAALEGLGVDADRAAEIAADLRAKDAERLAIQQAGGFITFGQQLARSRVTPQPLVQPKRESKRIDRPDPAPAEGARTGWS